MSVFIFYTVLAITAVIFVHVAIINASTAWVWKNVELIYRGISDPKAKALLAHREANPPWYERYYRWLERHAPGSKSRGEDR